MKKMFASFLLAISLMIVVSTSINACELHEPINPSDIVIESFKVVDVKYDDGWYYLVTETDKEGGQWVLDVMESNGENPHVKEELKMLFIGKKVDVQYVGDFELLSWYPLEK